MLDLRRQFASRAGLGEDQSLRDARLLANVLASAMFITLLTAAVVWLHARSAAVFFVFGVALLMQIPPWLLLRRGRLMLAAGLLNGLMWLFFATLSMVQGGLASEQVMGHLLVIILAVLLQGVRVGFVFTGLSVLWQGFLAFGLPELKNVYQFIPESFWPRWASVSVFFLMGYILLALTYRNLREALEESRSLEERYRSLFEQSNDAILIRSLDLPFRTLANQRAAQLLGYDLDDLMQISLTNLAVPEEREEDARVLERLLQGEDVPAYERRLLRSDGQQIVAEINASLVRDAAGKPQYLQSIIRDYTRRRESHLRLKATEQRFQALFESTNDGVFLFGLDMINLAVNPQGAAMMGRTPDEIVGRPVMDFTAPEERNQPENVRDALLSGKRLPMYERTMLHKDGSRIIVEISAAMVVDDEGRPLYIQSIARDITWRKKLEEQLTHSLQETEALARTDSLTGLMNRRAVEEYSASQVQRALRENTPLSVVMLDMDDLKEINDTYGHQSGDEALKHFAGLLNHSKRGYDCAGRWAGDEFVLVLPGTRLEDAERMAERLQEMLHQQPLKLDGHAVTLGASIGAADLPLKSGLNYTLDDLVRWADTALYAAKQQGKGQVRLHHHSANP